LAEERELPVEHQPREIELLQIDSIEELREIFRAPFELRVLERRHEVVDVRQLRAPVLELIPVAEEVRRQADAAEVGLHARARREDERLVLRGAHRILMTWRRSRRARASGDRARVSSPAASMTGTFGAISASVRQSAWHGCATTMTSAR